LLPTAFALMVAGLDFAVAALCFAWPKGELWPLESRWIGVAMALSGVTSVAAAMVMAGIVPVLALHVFIAGTIGCFAPGVAGAIPSDAPGVARRRLQVSLISLALVAGVLATLDVRPTETVGPGVPWLVLAPPSALALAVACGGFQVLLALVITRFWPQSQARSSRAASALVFVAGFIDLAALLGAPVPLIGAVTAAAIASGYIASRMLAQFRVALQGAEGRVPGYALQRFLGAGGMAEVFMAEAVGLVGEKRVAAVKRVRRDLVDNQELCSLFLDEARLASQLRHPNIVEVYAVGTGEAGSAVRPYIAMELVDGLALALILRFSSAFDRRLPLGAVAEIGVALSAALQYAHTLRGPDGELLRIVHRDVSPHNVLISREGAVKLIDFGIARAATRETQTRAGHMRGKLAYAAPEQLRGTAIDARTDIFSLGVLLYEAATLTRPFHGDSEPEIVGAILEGRRRPITSLRQDAGALGEVIERAMQSDPDARWQSARELGQALRRAFEEPLPGPRVLSGLVAMVDAERSGLRNLPSLPPPPLSASTTISSHPGDPDGTTTAIDPPVRRGL
jgi:serine/threonine protein kinase